MWFQPYHNEHWMETKPNAIWSRCPSGSLAWFKDTKQKHGIKSKIISYPLYVYVRCRWGHINGVNLRLLRGSSLGSWPTPSPPYSLSGTPQRHAHQRHHCQHATPNSSHPNNDSNNLFPMGLLRFLCSYFFSKIFSYSVCIAVSVLSVSVCTLFPICFTQPQIQTQKNCINRQKAGDKQWETEDGLWS